MGRRRSTTRGARVTMTRSTRANLDPRGALRERLRANRRGALLDEPSDDLRDNIAYRGGALERVMFALPFAMSMALISFVTVWGFRCCTRTRTWIGTPSETIRRRNHRCTIDLWEVRVRCTRRTRRQPWSGRRNTRGRAA